MLEFKQMTRGFWVADSLSKPNSEKYCIDLDEDGEGLFYVSGPDIRIDASFITLEAAMDFLNKHDEQLTNKSWDTLYKQYPELFSNKDKDITTSCMAWGCECGFGWFDILSSLCWMIKEHENNIRWQTEYKQKDNPEYQSDYFPVKFDQIKEKYGGLRVYFSGGDDYISGLVDMAESMSYKICESCGQKGSPNKGGWISTLCDNCRNKTNVS
jgi:hypothetical protein